jgi:hypothetical protein
MLHISDIECELHGMPKGEAFRSNIQSRFL